MLIGIYSGVKADQEKRAADDLYNEAIRSPTAIVRTAAADTVKTGGQPRIYGR